MNLNKKSFSFKEYCLAFIYNKNSHLTDSWGWFIDIDIENNNNININKKYLLNIPTTIYEEPHIRQRIRSRNSITNLNEHIPIKEYSHEYHDSVVDNRCNILCVFGVLCVFWFSIS
jgi:hypothetical protein